ncbi:MAG: glycerol-3-phosphate acyltransferase, partial [Bacillota bacterium]|nr:glycerol-3-phosphate acyltransferase [Bacillota bacterium]
GSGNVGGTNALRVLGIGPGIAVAVTDFSKAVIPTYVALHVLNLPLWQALTVAAAAIIGHNWSVYIGFKGGKGIACTIGVAAVLFPETLFMALLLAVLSVLVTRYVSVGSLLLTALMPIILFYNRHPQEYVWFAVFLMILATYRHRGNIERLLNGTERKIGKK